MDARNIIRRWPSRNILAADAGRKRTTIDSWWRRNSIPGDVDWTLMQAAKLRGLDVTFEMLARSRAEATA